MSYCFGSERGLLLARVYMREPPCIRVSLLNFRQASDIVILNRDLFANLEVQDVSTGKALFSRPSPASRYSGFCTAMHCRDLKRQGAAKVRTPHAHHAGTSPSGAPGAGGSHRHCWPHGPGGGCPARSARPFVAATPPHGCPPEARAVIYGPSACRRRGAGRSRLQATEPGGPGFAGITLRGRRQPRGRLRTILAWTSDS